MKTITYDETKYKLLPIELLSDAIATIADYLNGVDIGSYDRKTLGKLKEIYASPASEEAPQQEPIRFKDAPERIYLHVCNMDDGDCNHPFSAHDEVTWCSESQHEHDVPYVRADKAGAQQPATHEEAPQNEPKDLNEIEQYRMQMAGICTAALGYWKEGDDIHPDYDTPALRDVARLYAKYAELYAKQQPATHGEPVAVVDANDDGYWADILPDRDVKVGQFLYSAPQATPELVQAAKQALEAFGHGVTQLNGIGIPLEAEPLHTALIALQNALKDQS